jgi:hypothetical protein
MKIYAYIEDIKGDIESNHRGLTRKSVINKVIKTNEHSSARIAINEQIEYGQSYKEYLRAIDGTLKNGKYFVAYSVKIRPATEKEINDYLGK